MAPNNPLTLHGNEKTMNLNTLILTNIQSSPYFKVKLFELKTYHQVIDEIYYKVEHLEPWEKGSRKTAGQTGMCGGVRGVGAGGIVSSAYCLLYKLFTLKLTKKQVIGLITHQDSPYIRGLGFMYIRYTQNPADLWDWYEEYLEDEEELDVKAGSGHIMTIGEMVMQWLTKLEWYSTLFPRIPVPIQKQIEAHLREHNMKKGLNAPVPDPVPVEPEARNHGNRPRDARRQEGGEFGFGEAERVAKLRESPLRGSSSDRKREGRSTPPFDIAKAMDRDRHSDVRSQKRRSRSRERDHDRSQHRNRDKHRSRSRDRGSRKTRDESRERYRKKRSRSRDRQRSRSRDRHRHRRSRSREHSHKESRSRDHRESSFDRALRRERDRIKNGR